MKRLMILTVVVLMGVSGIAKAGPWTSFSFGGYGYSGYGQTLGQYWAPRRSSYGGYGGYGGYGYGRDRTLGRVMGYGGLAIDALQMLSQISANDRVLSMAEREQILRHQARAQGGNTVLIIREPASYPARGRPEEAQENEKLRQDIEMLELELKKLKLQQEIAEQTSE